MFGVDIKDKIRAPGTALSLKSKASDIEGWHVTEPAIRPCLLDLAFPRESKGMLDQLSFFHLTGEVESWCSGDLGNRVGPWPAGNSTDHNRKTHKSWSVEGELD